MLNAEISATYQALTVGREPALAAAGTDYPEYASHQRGRLAGSSLDEELSFWQRRLHGLPTLELPADRPRPPDGNHRGASVIRALAPQTRAAAQALADQTGLSLFMVLAAAVNVVLSGYTGQDDIVIGVPMLGRPDPELEEVVGLFINMP